MIAASNDEKSGGNPREGYPERNLGNENPWTASHFSVADMESNVPRLRRHVAEIAATFAYDDNRALATTSRQTDGAGHEGRKMHVGRLLFILLAVAILAGCERSDAKVDACAVVGGFGLPAPPDVDLVPWRRDGTSPRLGVDPARAAAAAERVGADDAVVTALYRIAEAEEAKLAWTKRTRPTLEEWCNRYELDAKRLMAETDIVSEWCRDNPYLELTD